MDELISKYQSLGILLDTNVLLHLIGNLDRNFVSSFTRTRQFTPDDFDTLEEFLARFSIFSTTPNVMSEISNLVDKIDGKRRAAFYALFSRVIEVLREHYIETVTISPKAWFPRIGVTDSGIIEAARGRYLVLTDDFLLTQYLAGENVDVINFNHLRTWARDI